MRYTKRDGRQITCLMVIHPVGMKRSLGPDELVASEDFPSPFVFSATPGLHGQRGPRPCLGVAALWR
jgi:hypothetical protein